VKKIKIKEEYLKYKSCIASRATVVKKKSQSFHHFTMSAFEKINFDPARNITQESCLKPILKIEQQSTVKTEVWADAKTDEDTHSIAGENPTAWITKKPRMVNSKASNKPTRQVYGNCRRRKKKCDLECPCAFCAGMTWSCEYLWPRYHQAVPISKLLVKHRLTYVNCLLSSPAIQSVTGASVCTSNLKYIS
jgi:hypothetical protein